VQTTTGFRYGLAVRSAFQFQHIRETWIEITVADDDAAPTQISGPIQQKETRHRSMDLLPEDLLVDILRCLPLRPLALCRSVSRPGFILPVRKKPEVSEKRVYRISRKFFGFVVFTSIKI
jgi:hypothetical protein